MDTTVAPIYDLKYKPTVYNYLRNEKTLPSVWCEGCSIGIIFAAFMRAVERAKLSKDEIVLVSGIGCSSRIPIYADFCAMHTTHGRPISFATGIKIAKPELKVVVFTGDGDCLAIGGNHFIHAARRNIGITVIIVNNNIYGMTGGQYSPTTPLDAYSQTSPYGCVERPFDICSLAIASGASFVARGSSYATTELDKLIQRAIFKKGFAVLDVISHCHTLYGRLNKMPTSTQMMEWEKEHTVSQAQAAKMSSEELKDKFVTGVIHDIDIKEYNEIYQKVIEKAKIN